FHTSPRQKAGGPNSARHTRLRQSEPRLSCSADDRWCDIVIAAPDILILGEPGGTFPLLLLAAAAAAAHAHRHARRATGTGPSGQPGPLRGRRLFRGLRGRAGQAAIAAQAASFTGEPTATETAGAQATAEAATAEATASAETA